MIIMDSWIKESFEQLGFEYIFKHKDEVLWDDTYNLLKYKSVDYLGSNINYQIEYQTQNYDVFKDISIIIISENKPIAIWPISIAYLSDINSLSSQGGNILPPIFIPDCPKKIYKKCLTNVYSVVSNLNKHSSYNSWTSSSIFLNSLSLDEWHLLCVANNAECSVHYNLYIDLSMNMENIKSKFRSSYKTKVNRGSELWNIEVHDSSIKNEIWKEFEKLHLDVAGRVTRSKNSWKIQYENIRKDEGFMVSLKDNDCLVGAAYISCSQDEGRYDVGAYNRDLFDKPLGHVVQYAVMEELKSRNIKFYKIGRRHYQNEEPEPSSKELSISHFKEGFGSYTLPEYILKNNNN